MQVTQEGPEWVQAEMARVKAKLAETICEAKKTALQLRLNVLESFATLTNIAPAETK
jgi:hypothetical protein